MSKKFHKRSEIYKYAEEHTDAIFVDSEGHHWTWGFRVGHVPIRDKAIRTESLPLTLKEPEPEYEEIEMHEYYYPRTATLYWCANDGDQGTRTTTPPRTIKVPKS